MVASVALLVILFWAGLGAAVGYVIGRDKGLGATGGWLGLFLGVIGWVIVALLPARPGLARQTLPYGQVAPSGGVGLPVDAGPTDSRTCPFCAETIRSAAVLCRYCGRELVPMVALSVPLHRPNAAAVGPQIVCEECGGTFGTQADRDVHAEAIHSRPIPVRCPECGDGFRTGIGLSVHLNGVHGRQPGRYPCARCSKAYESHELLALHARGTHGG